MIADVKADDINSPFLQDFDQLPDGVDFEKVTLSLKSETTLSLYFKSDSELTFACEGRTVEKEIVGKYQVARIRGISAQDLGDNFTLTVSDQVNAGSVIYSPMIYCYNALNRNAGTEKLQNVVKALYLYYNAAFDFFNG